VRTTSPLVRPDVCTVDNGVYRVNPEDAPRGLIVAAPRRTRGIRSPISLYAPRDSVPRVLLSVGLFSCFDKVELFACALLDLRIGALAQEPIQPGIR